MNMSARAKLTFLRSYCREKSPGEFETFTEVVDRVIDHQRWLYCRALGNEDAYWSKYKISEVETHLARLRDLMLNMKAMPAGRTLWLGGTDVSKKLNISQFNCAFAPISTVNDVVDLFWLLLNTCGVGFEPKRGTLNGFAKPHNVTFIRSKRANTDKGPEHNSETVENNTWTITIGDSAKAWAKSVGKLLAGKHHVDNLVIDFSRIRGAGYRLSGYGYLSAGDELLHNGFRGICEILNRRVDQLLTAVDIMDICNYLGSVLSTRRAAEICQLPFDDVEWEDFATAKRNHIVDNPQRSQSNNSTVYFRRPSKRELKNSFRLMVESGGSEPGIINMEAAQRKQPYTQGLNPCLPGFSEVIVRREDEDGVYCELERLNNVHPGDVIWSKEGWTTVVDIWSNGYKNVYAFYAGKFAFYSTIDHRIVSNGEKVQIGLAKSIDVCPLPDDNFDPKGPFGYYATREKNFKIDDMLYVKECEVYDLTVDNNSHTFWCNGFDTSNCGESLLSRYSLCNLVEVNLPAIPTYSELKYTFEVVARANYLQTCVDLRDGILQDAWHETNEFLRLCGVGITGIGLWDHTIVSSTPERSFQIMRNIVRETIKSFSAHLNMPNSKATTLVKPSGTLSKCMDTWEGLHRPIGKYLFNRINFSEHDPNLNELERCGYEITVNPMDSTSRLVNFPVKWDSNFFVEENGVYLNKETAIDQLNRYKLISNNYCDHNASITVFYEPHEIPEIIDWVYHNWDDYIGVTFFPRQDPTMTAADLGYAYLPQQVVTAEHYHEYADKLLPVRDFAGFSDVQLDDECKGGACPIR